MFYFCYICVCMCLCVCQEMSDSYVGSMRSGERKRVTIAQALLSSPSVLFLDEPTTGLDSEAALQVVTYLRRVARCTGVVCLVTLHQPSAEIFHMIDDLLLLTRGKTAYFGLASHAAEYMASVGFIVPSTINLADYLLDLVNVQKPEQLKELLPAVSHNIYYTQSHVQKTNTNYIYITADYAFILTFFYSFFLYLLFVIFLLYRMKKPHLSYLNQCLCGRTHI